MNAVDQHPGFNTALECRQWIAVTPLSNAVQALSLLLRQLNLLNRSAVAPQERLAILEVMRKRLLHAQEESARRFIGKALPLVPPEQAAFDSAQAVWQALLKGYGRCMEGDIAHAENGNQRLAVLFQRAFATLAAAQIDIYRAGFEPTPENWLSLHKVYAAAERAGILDIEVEDTVRHGKMLATPRAAYIEILLLHAASPHELTSRQLAWVIRWARRWARKVKVVAAPPSLDGETVPLQVDLATGRPGSYHPFDGNERRWLDTSSVRRSLKKRLSLLEKGASPAELHLGDDCPQPACGKALKQVYQRWCRGGINRKHERTPNNAHCAIVTGAESIYFQLSGQKPFRQPGYSDDDALRRERDEIATFGHVAPRSLDGLGRQPGQRIEDWNVVEEWQMSDESATGIHATHPLNNELERLNQRQLLAIRPPSANAFLIGNLRWSMVTGDARLHIGIMILPGRPEPVATRAIEPSGVREPYKPAFVLPAMPTVGTAASIITPPGTFRAGRILELVSDKRQRVRLLQLLDRGIDFDRVSFEPVA